MRKLIYYDFSIMSNYDSFPYSFSCLLFFCSSLFVLIFLTSCNTFFLFRSRIIFLFCKLFQLIISFSRFFPLFEVSFKRLKIQFLSDAKSGNILLSYHLIQYLIFSKWDSLHYHACVPSFHNFSPHSETIRKLCLQKLEQIKRNFC